ncbi:MAG TPA: ABC transporter ATP-binding protein [Actinomycetales bacterium]|nr:ABC transporter ATP-binding protein [Actinomycetales bacterium]
MRGLAARSGLTGGTIRRSLQLFWRGLRAKPRLFALGIFGSAIYGASTVASGWMVGRLTDEVATPAIRGAAEVTARHVWMAGGVLALIALMTAIGVVGRRAVTGAAVFHLQAHKRREVTHQYVKLPLAWHRRHPTGQLLSNASADVEAATQVFNPLPFALGVILMLFIAGWAMLAADYVLGIAGMIILPGILVANAIYRRHMSPLVTRAQQLRAEVADVAHESFDGALVVKSLGLEGRESDRFEKSTMRLRDANIAVGRTRAVFDPVMDALPTLATLLVLAVGTVRISIGAAATGDVVMASFLLTLMTHPVRSIGFVLGELPRALVGWERISRVIDARDRLPAGTTDITGQGPAHVTVRQLSYSHRDPATGAETTVLDQLDLDVTPGKTVALVGATGSGKSTLANLLVRLDAPTSGDVLIDGTSLSKWSATARAQQIALVSQETFLFDDTLRGNITLADPGDGPSDDVVWDALETARATGFVSALPDGLDTTVGERGASLSGGQRQRIAIARALVRSPRLLILDDATSAVDPEVEQSILSGLRNQRSGATVIVIAYRMATIAAADEVIHLDEGRIIAQGTHAELLKRDAKYRTLLTAYERESQERVG